MGPIRIYKYRNRAMEKKRKTRFCPWAAYLRRKKGMGGELAESGAQIDRMEKEGGERRRAASEDHAEDEAEWGDWHVAIFPDCPYSGEKR